MSETFIFYAGLLAGVLVTLCIIPLPKRRESTPVVLGKDVSVPRAVCVPTAWRRRS